jgi:hypothetical protein
MLALIDFPHGMPWFSQVPWVPLPRPWHHLGRGFSLADGFVPNLGCLHQAAPISDPDVCPVFVWKAVYTPHGPIGFAHLNGVGPNRIRNYGELRMSHRINMSQESIVFQPRNAAATELLFYRSGLF